MFIRYRDRHYAVRFRNLLFIEADTAYCTLYAKDSPVVKLSMNLKQLSDKLKYPYFLRIHRSYIVNLEKVDSYDGNRLFVGDKEIPIGRSYREGFLQRIQKI